MSSKSPINITEEAITTALQSVTDLAGYTITNGQSDGELILPSIVVSCESASYPAGLAQGLGNYLCRVSIGVFTNVDDATQANHQTAVQNVTGQIDDLATLKGFFTAIDAAGCYDATLTDLSAGRGDRCFMTTMAYDVLMVLPA